MHLVMVNAHSTRLCAARFESALWKLLLVFICPVKVLHPRNLPVDTLQCRNPLCVNSEHVSYIHRYATDLSEAYLAAAERVVPKTTQGH